MSYAYDVDDGSKCSKVFWEPLTKAAGAISGLGFRPVQKPTYTIFKEGSTYYRRNGTNGEVEESNTNAATLIQDAITAAPETGTVYCKGVLDLTSGLTISAVTHKHLNLIFDTLYFANTLNADAITVDGGASSYTWYGNIIGKYLAVAYADYSKSALKLRNCYYGMVYVGTIYAAYWGAAGSAGVHVYGDGDGSFYNAVQVKNINAFETSVLLESAAGGFANANILRGTRAFGAKNGFKMINNGVNTSGNTFMGCVVDGWAGPTPWITEYGFYNQDEANVYLACQTIDMPVTTTADFFTDAQTGNKRPRLFGCQAARSKVSGSFIHFATNLFITENNGASQGTGAEQTIAHGLNGTPNYVRFFDKNGTDRANVYENKAADATSIYPWGVNGKDYYWEAKIV